MTLGSLMAFLAYLAMFYAPLTTLSQLTTWLTSFMTGCQRVFELLDTPTETHEPADPEPMPQAKGEIRFDNVTFGYERHRPVLKEVNFTIRPGEKIGIVGHSGSGKTTLVNLISRFYDVDSGRVLLDGVDIRELSDQRPPPARRRGAPGALFVSRHDLRQPRLRQARRHRRRGDHRRPRRPGTRLHPAQAAGIRHLAGRTRGRALRRRKAAGLDRAGLALRSQGADPGRSHEQRRHRVGKGDPGGAPRAHPRPHHAGDRASSEHAVRLGPHSRLRPGPPGRTRHARRAA